MTDEKMPIEKKSKKSKPNSSIKKKKKTAKSKESKVLIKDVIPETILEQVRFCAKI
jgi:hypothetical protein